MRINAEADPTNLMDLFKQREELLNEKILGRNSLMQEKKKDIKRELIEKGKKKGYLLLRK